MKRTFLPGLVVTVALASACGSTPTKDLEPPPGNPPPPEGVGGGQAEETPIPTNPPGPGGEPGIGDGAEPPAEDG